MPLNSEQIRVVGECLRAAAYGPFFPDGEFPAIFGLSRSQVAAVAEEWPVVLDAAEHTDHAIHNTFNNLIGYPIKKDKMEEWDSFISIDRAQLAKLFRIWQSTK